MNHPYCACHSHVHQPPACQARIKWKLLLLLLEISTSIRSPRWALTTIHQQFLCWTLLQSHTKKKHFAKFVAWRCAQLYLNVFLSNCTTGVWIVSGPDHTSHGESGLVIWRWTKSNFLGPLPECGKDQWHYNIVNYYVAHTLLTSCNVRRCKIVFQFQPLRERYVVATTSEATSCALLH